jgi:hypothetical protein
MSTDYTFEITGSHFSMRWELAELFSEAAWK